jgi:putative ABC transport system substrate-binding protein
MAVGFDPVERGFVASLTRPAGNITGLSTIGPELSESDSRAAQETVPKLTEVIVLWDPESPGDAQQLTLLEAAARTMQVRLRPLELRGPNSDLAGALSAARRAGAGALIAVDGSRIFGERVKIAELAARNQLPALAGFREFAEAGGLMTYGAALPDMHRRAATFVHKILKGAKPADLPVEQPTKFELVINLKTAKALGFAFPNPLRLRADHVID